MRGFGLLFIVLIVSGGFFSLSLGMVQADSTLPVPTVPEFTLKLVDYSYDTPPTQTTDPYTGETTTHPGYHIENKTIEVTIKNQNYPYPLMYEVRSKGHFEDWRDYTNPDGGSVSQSDGKYTVTTLRTEHLPDGAKVDVRVEALYGHREWDPNGVLGAPGGSWHFVGVRSGWSPIQTITFNKDSFGTPQQSLGSSEMASNPNYQAGFIWLELCLFVAIVIIIVLAALLILRKSTQSNKKDASRWP